MGFHAPCRRFIPSPRYWQTCNLKMYFVYTFSIRPTAGPQGDSLMELTFFTDYSLRVLMYLGLRHCELSSISEIADDYGISANHLVKVVHGLAQGGFVRTYRGKGGGVALAREPRDINIGAVVRYTEGPFKPVECFRGDYNHCVVTRVCRLAGILQDACDAFLATLDRYTLADLLTKPAALRQHLAIGIPSSRPGNAQHTNSLPFKTRLSRRGAGRR